MDARRFLTSTEADHLRARVREVERTTGAELVVVIATESGRYDRAEMFIGALCALMALAGADALALAQGGAGAPLWAQGAAVALGLLFGAVLGSSVRSLRRPFVSDAEIDEEVRRAALACYAERGIGETSHGAGILLYLSLFERRLEVVLDAAAHQAAADGFADRLCAVAAEALRRGARAQAIDAVLAEAERVLTAKLPPRSAPSELDDAVVLIHPRP